MPASSPRSSRGRVDVERLRERDIRAALQAGHRAARRELAGRRETLAITGLAGAAS